MNAPACFPQLPLGGASSAPPMPTVAAEGEAIPDNPQYRRLFGLTRPDQVMVSVVPYRPLGEDGTCGSSAALCDPTQPESHPLFDVLAEAGHPSAASLASIAALRSRHIAKGRTPQADADHGPAWWWHGIHEFWWQASDAANDRQRARKALIADAALIVARIDALDFRTQQEAASDE